MYNAQHHLIGAISRTGRVMLWHSAICGGFGDNNPPDDNGSTAGDRRNYTSDAPPSRPGSRWAPPRRSRSATSTPA